MEYMLIMVQMEYTMLDDNEYTLKMVLMHSSIVPKEGVD